MRCRTLLVALALAVLCQAAAAQNEQLILWYAQPAGKTPRVQRAGGNQPDIGLGGGVGSVFINNALPIGNGQLGALIAGGVEHERLALNEDSLWTGDENPSGDYDTMGSYQALGNLLLDFDGVGGVTDYKRDLDIGRALAHVTYKSGNVAFQREYFCSHPGQVLVARLTATSPGQYSGRITLKDAHAGAVSISANRLTDSGELANGLKYEAQLIVVNSGGTLAATDNEFVFSRCDSLTLYLAAGTDYAMNYASHYRGADPHGRISTRIEQASRIGWKALLSAHEADYGALFSRVSLDLGASTLAQRALPTDERKLRAAREFDPETEALLFQYGRYLLISCSRPGGLPANLQGLWNDVNNPPWHCDYHANINIEMNYWAPEVAGLPECASPFFDLTESQLPAWRIATAAAPAFKGPTAGFAIRTSHNIFGGMGWKWDLTADAWYCRHFYEHYAFTGDREFLARTAYPILKETCEFWAPRLKELPDGRLVAPHGWSPEHGPEEDGVSYNQEIIWDLFQNYVDAADELRINRPERDKIARLRDRLATPGIGSWGQLLEWLHEEHNPAYPELDTRNDHHRHTSHLFAVYPGHQISVEKTPELAAAAKVSLDARGDTGDVREWSLVWRAALYARLHDGGGAERELRQFLSGRNSCPNLFGLHPPMQIDGNFGFTAAVSEMLLQSQNGDLELLPALPERWKSGRITGLRARGGYTVDIAWRGGKLESAAVRQPSPKATVVKYNDKSVRLPPQAGRLLLNSSLERR